jgi:heme oxygenase
VVGCLYVLEGATLGGQVIARRLQETLKIGPENGASFFHGYGRDAGHLWKSFRAALAAYASDRWRQEQIIAGARDTFTHFEDWLCRGEADAAD